ncbi:TIR domain-containing protein [Mycobacterium asiaticum]|uniref:TIR domain-containing protein n=1 Tax=Mycobacterium asiaticum TaxID=1790 RepID=A0A1A3KQG2_MYCAS|nr:TIR domain-containing protein [Mycobacterium asiaticum]OBJ86613.1 hypothetical protein A5640_09590 [Mycobacterium asiaticum]
MTDGYDHDIFLSFPRAGTAFDWVCNHFHPILEKTLTDELGTEPEIYVYTEQETGVAWPENLAASLRRSRYLVAVWAPTYFRSPWCLAEWESMRQRERQLGLRTEEQPRGLVYPVVYRDGVSFPEQAKQIFTGKGDLSRWAYPSPIFEKTAEYVKFYKAMRVIAEELAGWLTVAPEWQPDWPVVRPDPGPAPPLPQPRL